MLFFSTAYNVYSNFFSLVNSRRLGAFIKVISFLHFIVLLLKLTFFSLPCLFISRVQCTLETIISMLYARVKLPPKADRQPPDLQRTNYRMSVIAAAY